MNNMEFAGQVAELLILTCSLIFRSRVYHGIFTEHFGGKRGMKTRMFLAAATLLPGVFLMQASGGTSVAVIDFDRAVSEAPGGKEAINKMTDFQDQQVAAITTKQKEAVDLENRLRTQERTLSPAARTELTKNLETARTSIQTMQEDAQRKIAQMRQELLVPVA